LVSNSIGGNMNALSRWVAGTAAVAILFSPLLARADDPFSNTLIKLTNLTTNTTGSGLGGPGVANAAGTVLTQTVVIGGGKPNVDVDVATISSSGSLQKTAGAPNSDDLRLLATATATRTNNVLPAGVSSATAVVDASASFTLPTSTTDNKGVVTFYRKWDIRLDGTDTGTLSGSTVGVAGAPLPAWSSQLPRDDGTSLLNLETVGPPPYPSKFASGGLGSRVIINSAQNANQNFPILPFALVNRGNTGSVILAVLPTTYKVDARLQTQVSAQSNVIAAGFQGSSATADFTSGPNEMDVAVKALGVPNKDGKPKAYADPFMSFDGSTVSMDPMPLNAIIMDAGQVFRTDDPTPGDPILAPLYTDPNSVVINVGSFSKTGASSNIVNFSDTPFNITVSGTVVLSGQLDDITADTSDPTTPVFDGNIVLDPGSFNNSISSPWLNEMETDVTRFSFDPDFIAATNDFQSPTSDFQGVNLIVVPEPATSSLIGATAAITCLRRRRRIA
jgi:hypothetical protein